MTTKQHLTKGMKIKIIEKGEVIDEAVVQSIRTGQYPQIETESLKLNPGQTTTFAFIKHTDSNRDGWRMIFEDPMSGGRCFSQHAPNYTFEPA